LQGNEYQKLAAVTESADYASIEKRLLTIRGMRLLHAHLGISSEGGEVADQLKKWLFYGKELDTVNLAEEIGDLFWYCALACNELGIDFESVMEQNIAKLKARYGDKFSAQSALNRDLTKERALLEGLRLVQDGDDSDKVICPDCRKLADDIPFYCEHCGQDLGQIGLVKTESPTAKRGIVFSDESVDICRQIVEREYKKNPEGLRAALKAIGLEDVLSDGNSQFPEDGDGLAEEYSVGPR
jgi:NTP pyrophosphatase (non-canonical NTP hydrolase)